MKTSSDQKFDELFQFARHLGTQHQISSHNRSNYSVWRTLSRDIKKLNRICQRYKALLELKISLPAASEWLVDNIYLINEQAQFIRKNFPKCYYRKLPTLINGPVKAQKRIYAIILTLLEQTDGLCDPETLKGFLWEYQTIQPLTMGELWAVPLIFRMTIIQKLRELFEVVNQDIPPLKQANVFFKRITPLLSDFSGTVHRSIQAIERRMDLSNPTVLVYLAKYIRERVECSSLAHWLEARTATHDLSLIELIEEEQHRQSQNRVTAGQLITSLRQISNVIWDLHFEELSLVDKTLRHDPAGVYPRMDFQSRDILRHNIEKFAKKWHISEHLLAEQVVDLAEKANQNSSEHNVEKHVGYYLIDEGRSQLSAALKIKKRLTYSVAEKLIRHSNLVYFPALAIFTGFALFAILHFFLPLVTRTTIWPLLILSLPALVLAGGWAVRQLHTLITFAFPPQRLLKMDFKKGVPKDCSTVVVIPTILSNSATIDSLVHKLELYYLANQDPHVYFALLTDFSDASQESLPGEEELIQEAILKIDELNSKYSDMGISRFFLFHRKRLWNRSEGKWMGWERKRGKLAEFNALLCGEKNNSFSHIHGNIDLLGNIRYVITLDTDTQLPRDSVKGLIGTLAHPLNRPVLDPDTKKIVRGYGLLQPKIAISHNSANRSFFSRLFGGQSGIDSYSGAVSDPYQDLFQRGIFTGKGIYDVRVFHNILWDRIPENSILSHDLLEGSLVKAGLVTDIELIDDYPVTYLNALERMHRWVRGDWQLLPWLGKKVRNRLGEKTSIRLDLICRWQMVDNLRRSLSGPSMMALIVVLLYNFNELPTPQWPLITITAVLCLNFIFDLYIGFKSGSALSHYFFRPLFSFGVLFHHTIKMIDAITRTLFRLFISHRKLLEWVTAEEAGRQLNNSFWGVFKKMLIGEVLILAAGTILWIVSGNIFMIIPLFIWFTAPFLVFLISQELKPRHEQLEDDDENYLRSIAWRTWRFFQEIVTEADQYLPPDNLQLDPPVGIAHRTSPTNIGLYLCSVVSACDFGYISLNKMLKRLGNTVDTLKKLPRWNGHFYNWYDTETLKPLHPIYVSTVDSGNLVVYLLAVRQGIIDCLEKTVLGKSVLWGLLDMVQWEESQFNRPLETLRAQLEAHLKNPPSTWIQWYQVLNSLQKSASDKSNETLQAIENRIHELEQLLPWLSNNISTEQPKLLNEPVCSIKELAAKTESILPDTISNPASLIVSEINDLAVKLDRLATEHDFRLLYDNEQRFFSIGYNVSDKKLDNSFYDLFASEIRQTSFVAIALGQIPMEHWFALKRTMTSVKNSPTLVSWSGTMFEYFMPLILLPSFPNTLWDLTYRMVVQKQIAYARKKKVPWGISESGYSLQDFHHNYQYHAFGVPGLGLKQGLEKDLVISPYSTFLAALQEKRLSVTNLRLLEQHQALGCYGFYEAIDFTPERLPKNSSQVIVKSHMAHHQGMIFNAIANILFNNCWQRRFTKDPRIEATVPLLQEKIPARALFITQPKNLLLMHDPDDRSIELRTFYKSDTFLPEPRFLSNGHYSVMISNSGSGYSRWGDLDLTKWVEDPVKDAVGSFYYIRNVYKNKVWSPTFHPCRVKGDEMKMEFSLGKIAFYRTDGDIHTSMQAIVVPDLDAEIREITLCNNGNEPCLLELTSFLELSLNHHERFQSHPVYSKMFIETEFVSGLDVLLAHRRNDSLQQPGPYMAHMLNVEGNTIGTLEYETDRSSFIGLGRSLSNPYVIQTGHPLSGTAGAVLDPIFSLRRQVNLPPHRKARFFSITAVARTRQEVLDICRKLRYPFQVRRAADLSTAQKKLQLNELDTSPQQANIYQWMGSQLIYFNCYRNQRAIAVNRNLKGQSGLWAYGISGDYPIISIDLYSHSQLNLAENMLKALKYWFVMGLKADLVFICREADGYNRSNIEELNKLITAQIQNENFSELKRHIFTLSYNQMPEEDRNLIAAVSRIQLDNQEGNTIVSQLVPNIEKNELPEEFPIKLPQECPYSITVPSPPEDLIFFNGWGGFKPDGSEYLIYLKANDSPPQPWINVIANPRFGFLLSESGGGYSWAENSREFKITPWSNDPVLDPLGEVCYLRDEEDGLLWSVTPQPIRDNEPYTIRHGQGYSIISHKYRDIEHEACYWTPLNDPVKIIELTIKNTGTKSRKLSVTYYLEWTLGVDREKSQHYVVTEMETTSGAILARNTYQDAFHDYHGFLNLWTGHPVIERSWTGNRHGFMGRNGTLRRPAGLARVSLDKLTGSSYNPCGAIQLKISLEANEEAVVYILVGAAQSRETAQKYLKQYSEADTVLQSRTEVLNFWQDTLGQVEVATPDQGFDFLINRWLIYQTLVCRFWARSAFYQSGGAYGYRDQLQDSLALLHTRANLARKQILFHAAHQFQEGDVQHWWHEETEAGIRTRYSDDLLWLVYTACCYVEHTGDDSIWDEMVPFITDDPLRPDENERYAKTRRSEEKASLYNHCVRAIERSLTFGSHSLPLIGGGDWNDGLNKVGLEGRGESVWLAWFLYTILEKFVPICTKHGEPERAEKYRSFMEQLSWALEKSAWDGQWYRRAYNDNGDPLGSVTNSECQIDCIAQAWAVISGAAPEEKAKTAMWSSYHKLVLHDKALINLLTPPFSQTQPSPGYIQNYPQGVRENGGQYTHGAVWAVIAWAKLGEGNLANELFRMINPIYHTQTQREAQIYRVEPYVMAADVYSAPPYAGRGGWSWYTGSASWMYQAGLEWILGIRRQRDHLILKPCISEHWPQYKVNYRFGKSLYEITVNNSHQKQSGLKSLILDGKELDPKEARIPLKDDGEKHQIIAEL